MGARVALATPATPAAALTLEVHRWRRLIALVPLPFELIRDEGRLALCHTIGGGREFAELRSRALYLLMDAGDVVAGRTWGGRRGCRKCRGSGFGYVHTPLVCAGLQAVARELGIVPAFRLLEVFT